MNNLERKIINAEKQFEAVKSKLEKLNNLKHEEEKKLLLRKHFVIGKMMWELMSNDDQYKKEVLQLVKENIKKPSDKKLFDLPIGLIKPVENLSSDPFNSPDALEEVPAN